jgi:hypothetical protein
MVVSLPVKDVGEVPLPKVVEGFTPPDSILAVLISDSKFF